MLLFSAHLVCILKNTIINNDFCCPTSPALTRRLLHLSCTTCIAVCCLTNFAAFMITLPLFGYLNYIIIIFKVSVIFVIPRNYTNPKCIQILVPYSFGKSLFSQARTSYNRPC